MGNCCAKPVGPTAGDKVEFEQVFTEPNTPRSVSLDPMNNMSTLVADASGDDTPTRRCSTTNRLFKEESDEQQRQSYGGRSDRNPLSRSNPWARADEELSRQSKGKTTRSSWTSSSSSSSSTTSENQRGTRVPTSAAQVTSRSSRTGSSIAVTMGNSISTTGSAFRFTAVGDGKTFVPMFASHAAPPSQNPEDSLDSLATDYADRFTQRVNIIPPLNAAESRVALHGWLSNTRAHLPTAHEYDPCPAMASA